MLVPTPSSAPGATASATAITDPLAAWISPGDAVESVVDFVDSPGLTGDLTVRGPIAGAVGSAYEVHGEHVIAWVNAQDGTLSTLLYADMTTSGPPTTNAESAVQTAQAYLDRHGVSVAGLDRTVRWADHGESSEFVVEWQGHVGEVRVPNMREVGIDAASGEVFRFVNVNRPFAQPPEPIVDKGTAQQIAVRAANGSPQATIDSTELVITFTRDGVQHLVWQVAVTDGISHTWVEIDSQTGVPVVTARG
jgi:hypothetical protein